MKNREHKRTFLIRKFPSFLPFLNPWTKNLLWWERTDGKTDICKWTDRYCTRMIPWKEIREFFLAPFPNPTTSKIPMESTEVFYHETSKKSSAELIHSKNIASHTHNQDSLLHYTLYPRSQNLKYYQLQLFLFVLSLSNLKPFYPVI
jgi:hypothetical protein